MAEAQLARIAEQQVQAHGGDDEDAGHDEHMQGVQVREPQRDGREESEPGNGERALHPIRSFCANSPVGLKIRMAMMRRKPMPSRKPEET